MNEERRETAKLWLDGASKIALVVAGIFAVWKYADAKEKEYQQPLWDQQIKLYFEVSDLTARLTNESPLPHWEKDKLRFYEIYWGSMILVEDEEVEKAMVQFGNHLYDFEQLKDAAQMESKMKLLREKAHAVSFACRDSIDQAIKRKSPSVRSRRDLKK